MLNVLNEFQAMFSAFYLNLPFLLACSALVWVIHFVNFLLRGRLNVLGVYPRRWWGLLGVVFMPFLHRDVKHLMMNTLMFLILGMMVLFLGKNIFWIATIEITVLSGFGVWLFGRASIHIGASALVLGYFGFLLVQAYHRPSFFSLLAAAICLYYFGGLFANLFPKEKNVSWEGHLIGFVSGIVTVYSYGWLMTQFSFLSHIV